MEEGRENLFFLTLEGAKSGGFLEKGGGFYPFLGKYVGKTRAKNTKLPVFGIAIGEGKWYNQSKK